MESSSPREAAAALLLRQRLRSLFFDVKKLSYDRPVVFSSYERFCRGTSMTVAQLTALEDLRDGCTLMRTQDDITTCVILYNEAQKNLRRRNFTLAHELGHIYLGHKEDNNQNETEANIFASEFVMPSSLVAELARKQGFWPNAQQLCSIFNISTEAATMRLDYIADYRPLSAAEQALPLRFGGLLPSSHGAVVDI